MAIFKKTFGKPGTYLAHINGKRKAVTITKEDNLRKVATTNAMLEDGHLIPAPYGHVDENGIQPVPLFRSEEGLVDEKTRKKPRWDQAVNAGFWKKFEVADDGSIVGYLETDGDEKDENTHAGRIGKTYKQVSPFFVPKWTGGDGKTREDAILHVCLTNRATEPKQENFTPSDQELAVAMSLSEEDIVGGVQMSDDEPKSSKSNMDGGSSSQENPADEAEDDSSEEAEKKGDEEAIHNDKLSELILALRERLEIELPEDTTPENVVERLLIIISNIPKEESEGLPKSEPDDADPEPTPVVMSQDQNADKKAVALLNVALSGKKKELKDRVNAMVKKGQVGRKHADEQLLPAIDGIAMSLDDLSVEEDSFTFPKFPVEMSLDLLEERPGLTDQTDESDEMPEDLEHDALDLPEDMEPVGKKKVSQDDADEFLASIPALN